VARSKVSRRGSGAHDIVEGWLRRERTLGLGVLLAFDEPHELVPEVAMERWTGRGRFVLGDEPAWGEGRWRPKVRRWRAGNLLGAVRRCSVEGGVGVVEPDGVDCSMKRAGVLAGCRSLPCQATTSSGE